MSQPIPYYNKKLPLTGNMAWKGKFSSFTKALAKEKLSSINFIRTNVRLLPGN